MRRALDVLKTEPSMTLDDWATLNKVGRNTAYREAAEGRIEGCYKIRGQYRISCAPWRRRFGIEEAA